MKSKLLAILCVLSLMGWSHAEEAASGKVAAITVGEANTTHYTTRRVVQPAVALIGETSYTSFDKAIDDANKAGAFQAVTVRLLRDVTRTENVALGAAYPITLDLAGFTLDCGTAQFRTQSTGLVTLTGNGTVKNSNTAEDSNCAAVFVEGASSLRLDGVTVEGTYGLYVNGTAEVLAAKVSATDVALAVNYSAQVTIGTAQGDNSAILFAGAGNSISTQAAAGASGMRVKIYGGTFKVTNPADWDYATIYWASHGALEVYGGSFENPGTGNAPALYQKNGSVTIAGGSFEGYDALKLGVEAPDTTEVVLTVTDGRFHALNRAGLYYKTQALGSNCTQYKISISGGTFTSNAPATTIKTVLDLSVITPSVNFTGGLFTADVSAYCAAGYMATETTVEGETLWAVQPAVAQIGEKLYASLAEAIAAAQSGDKVTLLQDVTQEELEAVAAKALVTTGPKGELKDATVEVAEVLGGAFTVTKEANPEAQTPKVKLSYHYNFGVAGLEVSAKDANGPQVLSVVAKLTDGDLPANRTLVGRTLQVVLKKGDGTGVETYSVDNPVFNEHGECRVAVPWKAMTHGTNAIKVKVVK